MAERPCTKSERPRQRQSTAHICATALGSREFHLSSRIRTLRAAVKAVKGGIGGKVTAVSLTFGPYSVSAQQPPMGCIPLHMSFFLKTNNDRVFGICALAGEREHGRQFRSGPASVLL